MLWFNHSQSCKYSHTDKILFKLYSIRKSFDIPANASQLNSEDLKQKGPKWTYEQWIKDDYSVGLLV